jgi:hypothetical protein
MSHIVICYANADGDDVAQQLAAVLESASWPCWMAPRDVLPGQPHPGQIVNAIRNSRGLVLLLTSGANRSEAVLQDVELACNYRKVIATLMVRGAVPSNALSVFLNAQHRLPWTGARAAAVELREVFSPTGTLPAAGARGTQDDRRTTETAGAGLHVAIADQARDLMHSGFSKGRQGDSQGEVTDYTNAIELAGAPAEQVATTLIYRAVTRWQRGDKGGAIADYTAVTALSGAPPGLVAEARKRLKSIVSLP